MYNQIKNLIKESTIYVIGLVMVRSIGFFLLPIYTNVFTRSDYGIISLAYAFMGFMVVILPFGSDAALLNFYVKNKEKRYHYLSSTYLMLSVSTFIFFITAFSFRSNLSGIFLRIHNPNFFTYTIVIISLDTLNSIPRLILRAENKPAFYNLFALINMLAILAFNFFLVIKLRMGITGIFYSNILSSLLIFVITLPIVLKRFDFRLFSLRYIKPVLKFGFPFLPSGIFAMILELSDRYILEILTGFETVGLYNAGYKLGSLMLLLVLGFNAGWQPFFLKYSQDKNAKIIFSKIATYVILFLSFSWLVITIWIKTIIQIKISDFSLIGKEYWSSVSITPIILLAYLFQALYLLQLPGIYFLKKTKYAPIFRGIGAFSNIALNFMLIPKYGITGAAIATCLSFLIMAIAIFCVSRQLFPIHYEWGRLIRIASITIIIYIIFLIISNDTIIWNILLTLLYPCGIWITGLLNDQERKFIRNLFF